MPGARPRRDRLGHRRQARDRSWLRCRRGRGRRTSTRRRRRAAPPRTLDEHAGTTPAQRVIHGIGTPASSEPPACSESSRERGWVSTNRRSSSARSAARRVAVDHGRNLAVRSERQRGARPAALAASRRGAAAPGRGRDGRHATAARKSQGVRAGRRWGRDVRRHPRRRAARRAAAATPGRGWAGGRGTAGPRARARPAASGGRPPAAQAASAGGIGGGGCRAQPDPVAYDVRAGGVVAEPLAARADQAAEERRPAAEVRRSPRSPISARTNACCAVTVPPSSRTTRSPSTSLPSDFPRVSVSTVVG